MKLLKFISEINLKDININFKKLSQVLEAVDIDADLIHRAIEYNNDSKNNIENENSNENEIENDFQIVNKNTDTNRILADEEADVTQNFVHEEEINEFDFERSDNNEENDSEDDSIFYAADQVFPISAESFSTENEVMNQFFLNMFTLTDVNLKKNDFFKKLGSKTNIICIDAKQLKQKKNVS